MFDLWAQTRRMHALLAVSRAGTRADCVLFRKAQEWRSLLCSEEPVDLIGTVDVQQWQGRTRVQIMIEEMKEWN